MPIKRPVFFFSQPGDRYTVKLERVEKKQTINTASYGGFKPIHKEILGEVDRDVTGKLL